MQPASAIPGYTLGSRDLAPSPLDTGDLLELMRSLLLGEDDIRALREAGDIVAPHVEAILDVWYGFVGANPHLLRYFSSESDGTPDGNYLAAVRKRFGQWILDTTAARYDQDWLNYQYEIGLRHHRMKKNKTDGANAAAHIPLRHVLALVYPIAATMKPFLEKGGSDRETVERMHAAWTKAVLLQAILWSYPYVRDGDF